MLFLKLVLLGVLVIPPQAFAVEKNPCDDDNLLEKFKECCPSNMGDVKCAIHVLEKLEDWLFRNNNYNILVAGKMGTGKTTLVMGLSGLASQDSDGEDSLRAHTVKVTPYQRQHDRVDFTFFDTPGLKDNVNSTNDHKYLKQMDIPDVLIFTMKMTDSKFHKADIDTIKNISNAFGWKVWDRAMFLLTFANIVTDPAAKRQRDNEVYYNRRRDDFAIKVTETLEDLSAEENVANDIAVVPVGLVKQPYIPSDMRKTVSWVDEFWDNIFTILKRSREAKSPQYKFRSGMEEEVESGTEKVESGTEPGTEQPEPEAKEEEEEEEAGDNWDWPDEDWDHEEL